MLQEYKHRVSLQTNSLIIFNEFILDHKLLKYPNNRLPATGLDVQQVVVFVILGHVTNILGKKNAEKKNQVILICHSQLTHVCKYVYMHLYCYISCHSGQCMSFRMRQMLVCHPVDTVGFIFFIAWIWGATGKSQLKN